MGLKEYKAKRNFRATPEPAGKVFASRPGSLFVVQKHDATRLHYDFRLELEGVLKSWAVPKGFPTQKGEKHLAVQVEDHPLDYADFEGTIPEGNYGAGTVMVWDFGEYEVFGADPLGQLQSGKLHFVLQGRKLKGEWTLVRMKSRGDEEKPQWLLLKSGDDVKPFSKSAETKSAVTQRTLDQIARQKDREWQSKRSIHEPKKSTRVSRSDRIGGRDTAAAPRSARLVGATVLRERPKPPTTAIRIDRESKSDQPWARELKGCPRETPGFVPPMKALLVDKLPAGADWLYEIKFDGVRALAIKRGRELRLVSRAEKELNSRFRPIVEVFGELAAHDAVLDGEVVAVDANGRPNFQLLQSYHMVPGRKPPLLYYVFDVLNLEGRNVRGLPLERRKQIVESLIRGLSDQVRISSSIDASSREVMRQMQARGLEGLIAKRRNSTYEPDRRSGAWVKFKWSQQQEFVIGGYTQPQGARNFFGAILVGFYQDGKLLFAGKVGTGFDEKLLKSLYALFRARVQPECPFANLPENIPGARGRGMTASEMRKCIWLKPELVGEVRFAEWTRDNHLRQPAFLGLREDKGAAEVVREKPA